MQKLQIALEFMILFSFVLILFLFIFAVVASQRAQTLSNQVFSQEQLVAQSISAQLDSALQAGNGYQASVPVIGSIGSTTYQLLITKNGAVIVNSTVSSQVIQAISYSSVKNVVSNPSYLQSGTSFYSLPIANGTMSIQNSFGTICIDYSCPTINTQPTNVSLSTQIVHVGQFNGQSSYITAGNIAGLTNKLTVSVWANLSSTSKTQHFINIDTSGISTEQIALQYQSNTVYLYSSGTSCYAYSRWQPSLSTSGGWYNIIATFNAGSYAMYINGYTQPVITIGSCASLATSGTNTYLGAFKNQVLKGRMGNVQVYSAVLSASQAQKLYSQGIASSPLLPANVVAWWPLNGDAKEYSGNGNNGAINSALLFPTVSQVFAKVTNQQGLPIQNVLVGFSTSLGNFGTIKSAVNYTNANGIAAAFLNQQQSNGAAVVTATAFNGNSTTTPGLFGWWPLNVNTGNTTNDISGAGNTGYFKGYASWTNPAYVGSFNGKNSYVYVPSTPSLQLTTQTWSFWFLANKLTSGTRFFVTGNPSAASSQTGIEAYITPILTLRFGAAGSNCDSVDTLVNNTWYYATATWNGSTFQCYLNGVIQGAVPPSGGTIASTDPVYIGANLPGTNVNYFNGKIANFQVYNTALPANQILQYYGLGPAAAPQTSSSAVGWWPLNGDALDFSHNNNNGTIFGNLNFVPSPSSTSSGNNASSILVGSFNGTTSMIKTPLSQNSLYAFTVAFWAKPTNQTVMTGSSGYTLFNSTGTNNFQLWLFGAGGLGTNEGSGDEAVGINGSSGFIYRGFGINNNSWNFMAVSVSPGYMTFYLNGATPFGHSITAAPYSINSLTIGQAAGGIGAYKGLLANIQVYNTSLNPPEMANIYSQGVAGIPPNTTDINTKLLFWYPLDGNAKDYSGFGRNGTATQVSYVPQSVSLPLIPNPISGEGASFNGQNSYISLPSGQAILGPTVTSGSVALWVNPYSYPVGTGVCCTGESTLIGVAKTNSNGYPDGFNTIAISLSSNSFDYPNKNVIMWTDSGISHPPFTSPTIPLNTWSLLVLNFTPYTSNAFVNGKLVATSSSPGTITLDSMAASIGNWRSSTDYFNGSIADAQLYNTPLNQVQVSQLYNAQIPPSATAVIPLSWIP